MRKNNLDRTHKRPEGDAQRFERHGPPPGQDRHGKGMVEHRHHAKVEKEPQSLVVDGVNDVDFVFVVNALELFQFFHYRRVIFDAYPPSFCDNSLEHCEGLVLGQGSVIMRESKQIDGAVYFYSMQPGKVSAHVLVNDSGAVQLL